ncbi:hypothetical protein C2W62_03025 [Candidatus Entotheonella serta]|nr:hypothetical protein C2W62_03025 [Candidatus Entotheonella serta]
MFAKMITRTRPERGAAIIPAHHHAIYLKNVSKMRGRVTLRTQHNTMSALADAVMTALFVNAVKQPQGFVT